MEYRRASILESLLVGLIVTVVGGVIVAFIVQEGRFARPQVAAPTEAVAQATVTSLTATLVPTTQPATIAVTSPTPVFGPTSPPTKTIATPTAAPHEPAVSPPSDSASWTRIFSWTWLSRSWTRLVATWHSVAGIRPHTFQSVVTQWMGFIAFVVVGAILGFRLGEWLTWSPRFRGRRFSMYDPRLSFDEKETPLSAIFLDILAAILGAGLGGVLAYSWFGLEVYGTWLSAAVGVAALIVLYRLAGFWWSRR